MTRPAGALRPVQLTGLGHHGAAGADPEAFAATLRAGRTALVPVTGPAPRPSPDGEAPVPALHAPAPDPDLDAATLELAGVPDEVRTRALRTAGRAPRPVRASVLAALQAWLGAGLPGSPLPGHRVGLVVAANNSTEHYTEQCRPRYLRNPAYLPARYALHHQDTDCLATISRVLGITGEGFTVGGASAAGNLALAQGARLVATAEVDACLVVGTLVELSALQVCGYLTLGAMAARREGRPPPGAPFDRGHRGFSPGQAAAAVLLESAESAAARGARPLAELRGRQVVLDANNLADPSADGEAAAMTGALERSGVTPGQVAYVSTHGSGSPLGDRTELQALRRVFGDRLPEVRLNATKAVTGHCLGAAGVVEAVAVALQLSRGFLHPTPGLAEPIDDGCRFVGPRAEPVACGFALSNSFGFGGFNASLLFAAAGPPAPEPAPDQS